MSYIKPYNFMPIMSYNCEEVPITITREVASPTKEEDIGCMARFYRGKHRGELCGAKVFNHEKNLCERHNKCKTAQNQSQPKQCCAILRTKEQCPNVGFYTNDFCPRHVYKAPVGKKLVQELVQERIEELKS